MAAIAVLAILGCGAPARADDPAILRNAWDVTIGGGGRYTPEYEGGRHMNFELRPYFDVTWYDVNGRQRTFLNVDDGLGIYLLSTERFRLAPLITWRFGRQESDSSELRGLGNVDAGVQVGGLFEYQPHDCCITFLKVRRDVNDQSGSFVDIGADLTAPIVARHWFVNFRLTTTWADGEGLRPLFGITPAQSARSGLDVYNPSSGMRNVTAEPTLIYDFDGRWAIAARLTYERLLDGAADSPLIRTRGDANQYSYEMQLTYHF
jgi:outer membrane scaffolding protein for murein synthesis (MipA/OmpV family)